MLPVWRRVLPWHLAYKDMASCWRIWETWTDFLGWKVLANLFWWIFGWQNFCGHCFICFFLCCFLLYGFFKVSTLLKAFKASAAGREVSSLKPRQLFAVYFFCKFLCFKAGWCGYQAGAESECISTSFYRLNKTAKEMCFHWFGRFC